MFRVGDKIKVVGYSSSYDNVSFSIIEMSFPDPDYFYITTSDKETIRIMGSRIPMYREYMELDQKYCRERKLKRVLGQGTV